MILVHVCESARVGVDYTRQLLLCSTPRLFAWLPTQSLVKCYVAADPVCWPGNNNTCSSGNTAPIIVELPRVYILVFPFPVLFSLVDYIGALHTVVN